MLRDQPGLRERLREGLTGQGGPGRLEMVLESAGPAPATIGFSVATVRDGSGTIRGAAIQFRDLTPIERRAARERLRERLVALGETAAGLAHEIRNPLAAIEISAGLLKRRLIHDPDALELLEDLHGEVSHVAAIVNQSLEFVRPSALEPEPVDAVILLGECIRVARARAEYRGEVAVADSRTPIPPLWVDAEGMRSVFTNLVLNAFEAMADVDPEAQRVEISLRCEGASEGGDPEVVISVRDNGPGIAPEQRERIFYPFFTTKQAGSGVGLALAQKIVAEHGGRLELESEPECGTVFRVHLPAHAEPRHCDAPNGPRAAGEGEAS